jgi:hypothetical protein
MRSKFEESFAHDLDTREIDYEYEPEALVYYRNYIPDFKVTLGGGRVFYVETKGHLKSSDRTKLLSVRRANPDIDLRIVFQRSTEKLNRNSSTTYGDWATANGFIWADKTIPDDWLR